MADYAESCSRDFHTPCITSSIRARSASSASFTGIVIRIAGSRVPGHNETLLLAARCGVRQAGAVLAHVARPAAFYLTRCSRTLGVEVVG
jgi:hypothetical protein